MLGLVHVDFVIGRVDIIGMCLNNIKLLGVSGS